MKGFDDNQCGVGGGGVGCIYDFEMECFGASQGQTKVGYGIESSLPCGLFCLSFSDIFQIPSPLLDPIDWMPGGAFIEGINLVIGWFWEVSTSCAVAAGCFLGFMLLGKLRVRIRVRVRFTWDHCWGLFF